MVSGAKNDGPKVKTVEEAKAVGKQPADGNVKFYVLTIGGNGIQFILKTRGLNKVFPKIPVKASRGQTVGKALRGKGEFKDEMFEKECVLFDISQKKIIELSDLVDDLDGQTHRIIRLRDILDIRPFDTDKLSQWLANLDLGGGQ